MPNDPLTGWRVPPAPDPAAWCSVVCAEDGCQETTEVAVVYVDQLAGRWRSRSHYRGTGLTTSSS